MPSPPTIPSQVRLLTESPGAEIPATESPGDVHILTRFHFHHFLVWLQKSFSTDSNNKHSLFDDSQRIRFFHDPNLTFNHSELGISYPIDDSKNEQSARFPPQNLRHSKQLQIWTSFLGLIGSVTPLPHFFSEEILHADPDDCPTLDFLNIFHHRAISLFCKHIHRLQLAPNFSLSPLDTWSKRLLAVSGVDIEENDSSEMNRCFPALRILPTLISAPSSKASMQLSLQRIFTSLLPNIEINIVEFTGGWVSVSDHKKKHLGDVKSKLGCSLLLGKKLFDPSCGFTIQILHLTPKQYKRFVPKGDLYNDLIFWVEQMLEEDLNMTLELHIDSATPISLLSAPLHSGQEQDQPHPFLGTLSWLGPKIQTQKVTFSLNR